MRHRSARRSTSLRVPPSFCSTPRGARRRGGSKTRSCVLRAADCVRPTSISSASTSTACPRLRGALPSMRYRHWRCSASARSRRCGWARAHAAKRRAASLLRAAELKAGLGKEKLVKAAAIEGTVLHDETIAPGPWTREIAAGNHLRIIDLEGQQAVDFLCYEQADLENR